MRYNALIYSAFRGGVFWVLHKNNSQNIRLVTNYLLPLQLVAFVFFYGTRKM